MTQQIPDKIGSQVLLIFPTIIKPVVPFPFHQIFNLKILTIKL